MTMKTKTMGLALSLAAASVLTLTGCGGSSSSTPPPPAAEAYNGKFVDSAVGGVSFACTGASGLTAADGTFGTCDAGSTVTFSIGGVTLGSSAVTGDGIFFVTDIVGTTRSDIGNDEVLKIAVLLQSLDSDGNPDNGITVPAEAAAALDAVASGPISAFTDEQLVAVTASVVTELVADYPDMNYVTAAEAEANLAETLEAIDNGTIAPPPAPTGSEGGS